MLADFGNNRVLELGRDGKPRWIIENLQGPIDVSRDEISAANRRSDRGVQGLPRDGTRFQGELILWKNVRDGLGSNVVNAQRLSNGHTFIALDNQLLEGRRRRGATVWTLPSNGLRGGRTRVRTA